ncbi:MAG: 2-oxoglutarate dehydrogenase complex dihydrolipoyllysine-residue succinyltransferase [Verrucomicrobia bacterium]|jgi:2-oxoglutarate dehydrogenase E2 component (dihydrolipoamide succinyltransferase)|nr:2-oxoglutarate dehydrogenase complex dihydrolipoyllysine-residue succinyltransferase [Verrucomicrobiota bacterium]
MSTTAVEIRVPSVGESVTEVEVGDWLKTEGDAVRKDETLVVLETDKATVEVPAPDAGRLAKVLKPRGSRVSVGDVIATLEVGAAPVAAAPPSSAPALTPAPAPVPHVMPAAARVLAEKGVSPAEVRGSGPGGRILKEDALRAGSASPPSAPAPASPPPAPAAPPVAAPAAGDRAEEVIPMSLLRRKIAENLVRAKSEAALLTTFNEVDMSVVMALRKEYQERFTERYQIKLGFMSFFVKAVVDALKEIPVLNAEVRGTSVVYRNYYDIGIAIGGGKGLVVPVLRHAERLSFAEVEQAISDFGRRAKEGKLKPEELAGGTFTITNGGIYGSLLSTPIVNPPQSGVLGMHAIQDRPVALNGQVVIRPMMYVALTYDHRIVDGREAVTFLRRVKEAIENPVRMLIEV